MHQVSLVLENYDLQIQIQNLIHFLTSHPSMGFIWLPVKDIISPLYPGILVKLADLTPKCFLNNPGCPRWTQSTESHSVMGPGEKSNKTTWTHDYRSPCSTSERGHSPLSQHFTSAGHRADTRFTAFAPAFPFNLTLSSLWFWFLLNNVKNVIFSQNLQNFHYIFKNSSYE